MEFGGVNIWLVLGLFVVFILGVYVLPQWRFKRSVKRVVAMFRKQKALDRIENAKTVDELGFHFQRTFIEQMLRGRDYRGYALSALLKAQIVLETEDGKLYLLEEKLPPAYR
jgi:hypothetical protein